MGRYGGDHAGRAAGERPAPWSWGWMRVIHAARAGGLALMAAGAVAQGVVPPPTTDPGRLRERFDVPAQPASAANLPEFRGGLRDTPPEALRAIRVTLHKVIVEGATVFTPEELSLLTAPYIGREISGADIFGMAQALTAHYRNAGYFLSLVIVPPQSLSDNTLTLRVIEGYVNEVFVQGDERMRQRLAAVGEKIRASRPLRADLLERYLLNANEFPGLQLRSVLTPSQVVGAADLTLIASVKPVEGFASIDNYGTRYLGPNQAMVGVSANQLLGVNDQWRYVGAGTGDAEMSYHQLSYSQVLDEEGLRAGVTVFQARTRPGDSLSQYDIRGRSDGVSLALGYPVLRTRNQSVLARLTYDSTDIDTDTLGVRTNEDRIRALRAGLSWLLLDRWDGQNTLDVDVSQGVGGTSKSDPLKSRTGADGMFSKLTFDYTRFQPLGPRWGVTAGVAGQWSGDTPLLSSEQFALGGRRFGRAYEAAELVGDRALALRLEPRYAGVTSLPWLPAYHLLAFYDVGEVTRVGAPTAGTPATQSLASAGVGTRLFMAGAVTAQVEAVWPLTKPLASAPDNGKAMRLLGSLAMRF